MVLTDHVLAKIGMGVLSRPPKHWRRNKDCMVERLPNEARRADNRGRRPTARVGLWGGGSKTPPHKLGNVVGGSAVSSLSGARGGVPTARRLSTIFRTQDSLSGHYIIMP